MNSDEPEDWEQKRQSKRSLVLLAAKLRTNDGIIEVRLRNLSRTGALLEAAVMPSVGAEVTFERGRTVVPARIAWVAQGRMGLQFLNAIEESEVLIHVGRPEKAAAPKPRRLFPPSE
jgi:hypothetical protein